MFNSVYFRYVRALLMVAVAAVTGFAQSTEQQFPTPVSINEINGIINAREIGDSRTTTYFYTFSGSQGDLFLNILSVNLNADIDLFIEQGLRPLTKIVVYADRGETETGRVVYLRRAEKLLLRVQGRSPNDDPGRFRFKFAGSFVAAASDSPLPPELPRVPATVVAESMPIDSDLKGVRDEKPESERVAVATSTQASEKEEDREKEIDKVEPKPKSKPKVVVTESLGEAEGERRKAKDRAVAEKKEKERAERDAAPRKATVDPMAAFTLVIIFRDGSRIERPMIEVSRFGVDKGVLTVVNKGGQTGRYSMTDIVSVTVQ